MKTPQPTIAPGAIDALLALFTTETAEGIRILTVDGDGVQVLDGPPLNTDVLAFDCLVVGHGTPNEPAVYSTMTPVPDLGRTTYRESAEVAMVASTFSGDNGMQARRDRLKSILTAVKALVDANKVTAAWDGLRLGGEFVWYPNVGDGTTLTVGFTIVAEAIV